MMKINQIRVFALLLFVGISHIAFAQEQLKIAWPDEYHWKIGSNQLSGQTRMVELIPGAETLSNWTIIGTMLTIKSPRNTTLDAVMNKFFSQTQVNAPQARLRMIEKGTKAGHPWILFKVESPRFKNSTVPESQLYYVIQGKQTLYANFVAVKQSALGVLFVEKWAKVFKASVLVE